MFLTPLDLGLILAVFGFVAVGFATGFIQALGSLIGVVLGAWLAGIWYQPVGELISPWLGNRRGLAMVLAFGLVYLLVTKVIGVGVWLVTKVFHLLKFIPFFGTFNRLLGGLLGLAEGILAAGLVLQVASKVVPSVAAPMIAQSTVAGMLLAASAMLLPLLPAALRLVKPAM